MQLIIGIQVLRVLVLQLRALLLQHKQLIILVLTVPSHLSQLSFNHQNRISLLFLKLESDIVKWLLSVG